MRVSSSKSEAMVLCRKTVNRSLWAGRELLPQAKEFKYLGILFTSEGKMEHEVDRRIGAAAAVMQALYWTVAVKRAELEGFEFTSRSTFQPHLWS